MDSCLSLCAACHRHLRSIDDPCPFCGATPVASAERPRPSRRLSRPAVLAFGAAVSASLAMGCAESTTVDAGSPPADAGALADAGGSDAGGSDAGTPSDDAGFDAGFDAGEIAMPYGAPPLRDEWV
ncbi:MAG: hypothetical protein H6719_21120 [Sandaracinaceae bacterium]|nr:hypothetical protein [Sandaracinaceae bacterium]